MKFTKKNVIRFLKNKGYEVKLIEGGYIGENELCNNSDAYVNLAKSTHGFEKGMDNYYYRDNEKMVYAYCIHLINGMVLFDTWQCFENWQEALIDQIEEIQNNNYKIKNR